MSNRATSRRADWFRRIDRRRMLIGLGAAAPLAAMGCAHRPSPELTPAHGGVRFPIATTFIEHMGTVVPDVAAATRFHSRLFNPAIMREANPTPLRCYVDLTPGYLAFGSRAGAARAFFDHFCVLLEDYDPEALAVALGAEGLPQNNPAFTLFPDPDGVGVQFYQHPGGWFPTVVRAEPLVEGPALVSPRGLEHVMLTVADVEASVVFYRRFFGALDRRDGETVWFDFPDTRLGLQRAPAGATPGIDRIRVRVAPFERARLAAELEGMGAVVAPVGREGLTMLGFVDPDGLNIELVAT
jgi:catechol 2,3-dioxygenase-like lactoylglutathione lyase family enzyme